MNLNMRVLALATIRAELSPLCGLRPHASFKPWHGEPRAAREAEEVGQVCAELYAVRLGERSADAARREQRAKRQRRRLLPLRRRLQLDERGCDLVPAVRRGGDEREERVAARRVDQLGVQAAAQQREPHPLQQAREQLRLGSGKSRVYLRPGRRAAATASSFAAAAGSSA